MTNCLNVGRLSPMIFGTARCVLTRSTDDRGELVSERLKVLFPRIGTLGPVVQPGMPIDGAEERPVCKKRQPTIRKVAGPNPARSTINLWAGPFPPARGSNLGARTIRRIRNDGSLVRQPSLFLSP